MNKLSRFKEIASIWQPKAFENSRYSQETWKYMFTKFKEYLNKEKEKLQDFEKILNKEKGYEIHLYGMLPMEFYEFIMNIFNNHEHKD